MKLLPARTAVLHYMNTVEEADVFQVMSALKSQFGNEKQFREDLFLEHLMSLECNGYLVQTGYDLDENGNLRIRYQINDDGRYAVEKYIAKEFRS
ncbi:transcriptional regulator [Streptococcus suis]|uniref:transcriptional regulator n=1 Tax=Streptococcus suis TaxID=1307 RepID=UPI001C9E0959|nr:transcriptional regulator [Streptococcus suis]QZS61798.1 transcriptional regulator [Streptococcus suis]